MLDPELHPVAVLTWLTSPQPDLDDVSPRDWLCAGNPPETVAELASSL